MLFRIHEDCYAPENAREQAVPQASGRRRPHRVGAAAGVAKRPRSHYRVMPGVLLTAEICGHGRVAEHGSATGLESDRKSYQRAQQGQCGAAGQGQGLAMEIRKVAN